MYIIIFCQKNYRNIKKERGKFNSREFQREREREGGGGGGGGRETERERKRWRIKKKWEKEERIEIRLEDLRKYDIKKQ